MALACQCFHPYKYAMPPSLNTSCPTLERSYKQASLNMHATIEV